MIVHRLGEKTLADRLHHARGLDERGERALREADRELLEPVAAGDAERFFDLLALEENARQVCGAAPIYVALQIAAQIARALAKAHAAQDAMAEALGFMPMCGRIVSGEELRSMPTLRRAGRRLSWLSVNILLNVAAASVIAFYQDTLAAVIALAAFLPIISDMSGCSGNQAVAVTMRELALGLVHEISTQKGLAVIAVWCVRCGITSGVPRTPFDPKAAVAAIGALPARRSSAARIVLSRSLITGRQTSTGTFVFLTIAEQVVHLAPIPVTIVK